MKGYRFKIDGKEYAVDVDGIDGRIADVSVNGVNYSVELEEEVPAAAPAPQAPSAQPAPASAPAPAASAPATGGKKVTSPLPGVIISVDVKEGQTVKRGQKVAVIEAMKMENEILSGVDGTVTAIYVNKGDSVLEGADIASIG